MLPNRNSSSKDNVNHWALQPRAESQPPEAVHRVPQERQSLLKNSTRFVRS
jgi:hypothetical protein